MARLRRAMDGRDYSLVAQKAPRMLRVKRYAKEAAVMVAVSRLKLGDREGAKQFLDKLPWDQKPDPATGSYLLACIRALEGDWDTAARLLAECVSANPSMGPQVVSNPWFRPLLTHPTLGEALRPTVPREGYA